LNYVELGRVCEGEGVQAVALHPRTAKQMFTGHAPWERIARLKDSVSIPVVGNGDVNSAEDVVAMLRVTGCDGVMIGRASMKNPWIYRQAAELLSGRAPSEPTLSERRDLIIHHFRLLEEQEAPHFALHKLRTFTGWYTHGIPGGRHLRTRINSLRTAEEFLRAVEEFFARSSVAA
jgi:tRNA-dihydrouridine synthase